MKHSEKLLKERNPIKPHRASLLPKRHALSQAVRDLLLPQRLTRRCIAPIMVAGLTGISSTALAGTLDVGDLNGTNGFAVNGEATRDGSGVSVSNAGDVNGDGIDDFIIGASGADPHEGFENAGSSYVLFGKAEGTFAHPTNLKDLRCEDGFFIAGEGTNHNSGYSVSDAGDINGDGFGDVVVGAPSADPYGEYSGAAYVVFGKSTEQEDCSVQLSELDGTDGFEINLGEPGYSYYGTGEYFGTSVSGAGDVNGDGFDDLIIGTPNSGDNGGSTYSGYGFYSGAAYVVFGRDDSVESFDSVVKLNELSTPNGEQGVRFEGWSSDGQLGESVAGVGDVNGDGIDDFIVAEPFADTDNFKNEHGNNVGTAHVVLGHNDFYGGIPSQYYCEVAFSIHATGDTGWTGQSMRVSGAGDINGDGIDDLLIGKPFDQPNGPLSGAAYVVFGTDQADLPPGNCYPNVTLSESGLNGTNGFVMYGEKLADRAGWSVSGTGDFNGDGADDVLIGASSADPNGSGSGAAYLVYGRHALTLAMGTETAGYEAVGDSIKFRYVVTNHNRYKSLPGPAIISDDLTTVACPGLSTVGNSDNFLDPGERVECTTTYQVTEDDFNAAAVTNQATATIGGMTSNRASLKVTTNQANPIYPDVYDSLFPAVIELGALREIENTDGIAIHGAKANELLGTDVSGVGDVNRDGFADLIVGAIGADPDGNDRAGVSYVILGAPNPDDECYVNCELSDEFKDSIIEEAKNDLDPSNDHFKTRDDVRPHDDFDGDGISNLVEFRNGTVPTDYYNGKTPTIRVITGNEQKGDPGERLGAPLVLAVQDQNGRPLANAPVLLVPEIVSALLGTTANGSDLRTPIVVRTGADGQAIVYIQA